MDRVSVESSNVASIGYDNTTHVLEVEFKGGQVYQYFGVPESEWLAFLEAGSKGSFIWTNLRGKYGYSKV